MKLLFFFIACFGLSACTKCKNNREELVIGRDEFMKDTIMKFESLVFKDKKGRDSLSLLSIPAIIIEVPKRTKVVMWYSMNYAIDGAGFLTIITEDGKKYDKINVPATAVAATVGILQDSYVRYDTASTTPVIISYKSQIEGMTDTLLKAF
jgi:hypothetical protein